MPSSTEILRQVLVEQKAGGLSEAALSDHGLNDDVYSTYNRHTPSVPQKALLIARLHELLSADGGQQIVERAVREGRLRHVLGPHFKWVLPLFEAEQ